MIVVVAPIALFVQIIFMFKREWLFDARSFKIILKISSVLFLISILARIFEVGDPKLLRALAIPLLAAVIFYLLKILYFGIYHRIPDDTFGSMDINKMSDGIFNALFWFMGVFFPTLIAYEVL